MTPENLRECLLPVVGLSPTDYDCATSAMPEGATDSLSGYYLTNCKDGMPIEFSGAVANCADIWDILTAARLDGVKNFVGDLAVEIGTKYKPIYQDFSGYIGRQDEANVVTNTKTFVAVEIKGRQLQSSLRVKGFKFYSTVTADVAVSLYSEDDLDTPWKRSRYRHWPVNGWLPRSPKRTFSICGTKTTPTQNATSLYGESRRAGMPERTK